MTAFRPAGSMDESAITFLAQAGSRSSKSTTAGFTAVSFPLLPTSSSSGIRVDMAFQEWPSSAFKRRLRFSYPQAGTVDQLIFGHPKVGAARRRQRLAARSKREERFALVAHLVNSTELARCRPQAEAQQCDQRNATRRGRQIDSPRGTPVNLTGVVSLLSGLDIHY